MHLTSISYSSEELKNLKDKDNPLDPINDLHSLSKRFTKEHGSYNRDNLQDWMNLLWSILNELNDKYTKVLKFKDLAINSPARVKYREAMKGKEHN